MNYFLSIMSSSKVLSGITYAFHQLKKGMCNARKLFWRWCNSADSWLIWQGAAPCSPFRHLICVLRTFSKLYMCPTALSVHISVSVCMSGSKSPKRLLNVGMKSTKKSWKNSQKVAWPFSKNLFIITGGINLKRNCMSLKMNENCFILLFSL